MRPSHEIIREIHEAYKLGEATARVMNKSEIKKREIERDLEAIAIAKANAVNAGTTWMSTGSVDEEMVEYIKSLSDEKKRYDN